MVSQHHKLHGHESEQTLGDTEGQRSLVCCSLWGHKEVQHDLATEQQQRFTSFSMLANVLIDFMLPT